MMVMFAQNYTDCISENVKRTHEQMVKEGKAMGLAPIGYKNIRTENDIADIILDTERDFLVRRLFEKYSTGLFSAEQLVDLAKQWGLNNKGKLHKPLCRSQIDKILKNPFYVGYAQRNGEYYKHSYPCIVSYELFKKCYEVRMSRTKNYTKKTKTQFVFSGLIKCKNCGCSVISEIKKGKYIYFRAKRKYRNLLF